MKNKIKAAYDSVQPSQETREAIWGKVLRQTENGKTNPGFRRTYVLAVCLALVVILSVMAGAAYRKWRLSAPETYTPNPDTGVYEVHGTETYSQIPEETEAEAALTDEYFLARAAEILEQVGLTDVDQSAMTVTRQEDLHWSREEVEVIFTESSNRTTLTFRAKDGQLVHLSDIEWVEMPEETACETREEAIALARDYIARLPVPQDYDYTGCTEYDDQYWVLEFCKKVGENLYNQYEMVRISLNPVSGRLAGVNLFCVPLLDDHGPEDVPLTQEQAEEIAKDRLAERLDNKELRSAEIGVVLPNWIFTDYIDGSGYPRASDVTRLGWSLVYEDPDSEFADIIWIYVDLYTGEILGGDMT